MAFLSGGRSLLARVLVISMLPATAAAQGLSLAGSLDTAVSVNAAAVPSAAGPAASKNTEAGASVSSPSAARSEAGGAAEVDGTEQPAAADTSWIAAFFAGTELGGLVDVYFDYNSNKTPGDAPLRNFDTKHNQFAFSMAQVWLSRPPTADSRAGFKVKLNFGPAASMINAFEPGGQEIFQNIQEGFISYLAPAGKGLQLDFGKFVTQHGAEVIEAKDNWNYSRSLLFALAIPYYHMGLRASYPVSDKVTLGGALVNGWNNVVENNDRKTYGVQLVVKPTSKVSIVQNYMGGPDQPGDNDDWRHLSDTMISYAATPELSVMGNYDYGRDTVQGATMHWQGFGGYLRYQANQWIAIAPRVEWYDDADGYTTGAVQSLKEVTLTFEIKPVDRFLWRIEYRGDFSDQPFFKKDTGAREKNQNTIAFGLIYSFSTNTP